VPDRKRTTHSGTEAVGANQQSELLTLQRRLARAERLSALGALTARIAHELGTPLHSVGGHLDILLNDPVLPAEAKARIEIISGEVARLESLIRSHLKRLRSPAPELAPTSVNDLTRRIILLMTPVFETRRIRVELDLSTAVGAPAACDPSQVEQVLMNLIQNALDAMPNGGRLSVRTATMDGGIAISVGDDGVGVAEEHLDQVFEPFFTTKATGRGTGLGLFLCREIARKHGGDIALDSKPGLGTVVTMTLEMEADT
jgi:signal transduction histidine kinase